MTERDDSGHRAKPLSKNAQDLEKSIKGTVDDLLETTPSGAAELSPETKGMLLGSTVVDLLNEHAELDREDRPFSMRPLWVWLILIAIVALGAAAIAGATFFLREDAGGGTDPGATPPVAAVQPEPADVAEAPTPSATADPAAPAAPADVSVLPDTWRFTGKWGLDVTVTLLPKGDGYGRISVKGEPDAKGSYTWSDSILKISYKQPATLLTGNVVDTKGRFTCEGEPTSSKLRCTVRALGWTSTSTSQNSQWLRFTATGRPLT